MRYLYTFLLYLLIPFILIRLYFKPDPAYRKRIGERFAFFSHPPERKGHLWIHCVSVGEFLAAKPLIDKTRVEQPDIPICITCTTPTASAQIQQTYADEQDIIHRYIPYDLPPLNKRFIRTIRPLCIVFMETEIWPNLLYQAEKWHIPVLLNNARLSERSYRRYKWIRPMLQPLLQGIYVTAQSDADRWRLQKIGVDPDRCYVTGNIKYYRQEIIDYPTNHPAIPADARPIWIAASTHNDEEQLMLETHKQLRKQLPQSLLIIAPRHPERREEIADYVRKHGFTPKLRSRKESISDMNDVFILDTLGELKTFYALSDIAVIGGSFIEHGGQNPLEALQQQCNILFGPQMRNFQSIVSEILSRRAGTQCTRNKLAENILSLWQNPERRKNELQQAEKLINEHQNVLDNQYQYLCELLIDARIGATPQAEFWQALRQGKEITEEIMKKGPKLGD